MLFACPDLVDDEGLSRPEVLIDMAQVSGRERDLDRRVGGRQRSVIVHRQHPQTSFQSHRDLWSVR
jgi:hypothetical protein